MYIRVEHQGGIFQGFYILGYVVDQRSTVKAKPGEFLAIELIFGGRMSLTFPLHIYYGLGDFTRLAHTERAH